MSAAPSQLDPRIAGALQTLQRLIVRRNLLIEAGKPCPILRLRIAWNMRRLRALEAGHV